MFYSALQCINSSASHLQRKKQAGKWHTNELLSECVFSCFCGARCGEKRRGMEVKVKAKKLMYMRCLERKKLEESDRNQSDRTAVRTLRLVLQR